MNLSEPLDIKSEHIFSLADFDEQKPFSSFLPGVAGDLGIPIWCFYVNRGQAISSFGVNNKDGAILEFQAANKAYSLTQFHGFRTFLKIKHSNTEFYYEPFQEKESEMISRQMNISPYSLQLIEKNNALNISIHIHYFTIPYDSFGGLARQVVITNHAPGLMDLEILDGLTQFNTMGVNHYALKNMSRTAEAWSNITFSKNNFIQSSVLTSMEDSEKVLFSNQSNFYTTQCWLGNKPIVPEIIVNPEAVFEHDLSFFKPKGFLKNSLKLKKDFFNRTPCAFSFVKAKAEPKSKLFLHTSVGMLNDKDQYESIHKKLSKKEYFYQKFNENYELIANLSSGAYINSSDSSLNGYAQQTYLDNALRGGEPKRITRHDTSINLYLYSRKHGDPERDYNSFQVSAKYFSDGNGNFRDICQNRRSDAWYAPETGEENLTYFLNLLQLDGYNPLLIKGLKYFVPKNKLQQLLKQVSYQETNDELRELLAYPFESGDLVQLFFKQDSKTGISLDNFLVQILSTAEKIENVEHGEGFWIDHWMYTFDLLESFEESFPDKVLQFLYKEPTFTFFDNDHYIVPRKNRYKSINGSLRQYDSVAVDKAKTKLIESRKIQKNKMRVKYGEGKIYRTTLFVKLWILFLNKVSSLDAKQAGLEMEAGKPGWNDSLNGLPGIFGSSLVESMKLLTFIRKLKLWQGKHAKTNFEVNLPKEVVNFSKSVLKNLEGYKNKKLNSFELWDMLNKNKEVFRKTVFYGIDGDESGLMGSHFENVLNITEAILSRSISKARDKETDLFTTYFINEPILDKKGLLKDFKQKPVRNFLEGQVYGLSVLKSATDRQKLAAAVQGSDLYDKKLKMHRVNGKIDHLPYEVGRIRSFTPGWLENGSIFLHMQYKYLLALLKAGLYKEFYSNFNKVLIPFKDPQVYGRSNLENVSFIASSLNPDSTIHGNGFVSRLSGATAEYLNIQKIMTMGRYPYQLNENKKLNLYFKPKLAGHLFHKKSNLMRLLIKNKRVDYKAEKNTFTFLLHKSCLVTYHNPARHNLYEHDKYEIEKIVFEEDKSKKTFYQSYLPDLESRKVRGLAECTLNIYYKK